MNFKLDEKELVILNLIKPIFNYDGKNDYLFLNVLNDKINIKEIFEFIKRILSKEHPNLKIVKSVTGAYDIKEGEVIIIKTEYFITPWRNN